ncbi:MAG: 3'(2'),5'-bisphosphate nucleotidase [Anaerolineales bacterium]|nr:3'(2'),5'-bisphosphate nucleotidase [Anaerolineales bacterium]
MLNTNTPEIQFALNTVRLASKLVAQVQSEMVTSALTKEDKSPVTVADYGAQALVGYLLDQTFPNDPLVGEEDSASLREEKNRETLERIAHFVGQYVGGATTDSVCQWIDRGSAESGKRYWTVDPIDGTKGFLRGDQYAVALALVENGIVQVGALGCPNLSFAYLTSDEATAFAPGNGSIVVAVRGQGTWAAPLAGGEFVRLTVSPRGDASQARMLRSLEEAHTNVGQIGELVTALNVQATPVGMDSQAKYAVLAAGKGDALVRLISAKMPDYKEKIWDQGAGSIVVEEAGGRITDLHGRTLDFTAGRTLAHNRGILASNGMLHKAFLEGLEKVGA